MLGQT
ncbi:hypothetical protein D039_0353A, partial [Vibrio parahaemolyticus EKP-028]